MTFDGNTYLLLMMMAAYVGLDPVNDIEWVTVTRTWSKASSKGRSMRSSACRPSRRICAQRKIGHAIVNTTVDRPWSQYFCCMLAGTADYVSRYPVATKRVLRAILKAADLCAFRSGSGCAEVVDRGFGSQL